MVKISNANIEVMFPNKHFNVEIFLFIYQDKDLIYKCDLTKRSATRLLGRIKRNERSIITIMIIK